MAEIKGSNTQFKTPPKATEEPRTPMCPWLESPTTMDVQIIFPPEVVTALQSIAENMKALATMQQEARDEQRKLAQAFAAANSIKR